MRTEQEYLNIEAERDALAARVKEMREGAELLMEWQVKNVDRWHNRPYDNMDAIINSPDNSVEILARLRADVLNEMAEKFEQIADDCGPEHSWTERACAYASAAEALRAKADELLKGLEK